MSALNTAEEGPRVSRAGVTVSEDAPYSASGPARVLESMTLL